MRNTAGMGATDIAEAAGPRLALINDEIIQVIAQMSGTPLGTSASNCGE